VTSRTKISQLIGTAPSDRFLFFVVEKSIIGQLAGRPGGIVAAFAPSISGEN